MASGVRAQFTDDPCEDFLFDFLVTPGLDQRGYGLLSLRDVLNSFDVRSLGDVAFDANRKLTSLPVLELIPRPPTS